MMNESFLLYRFDFCLDDDILVNGGVTAYGRISLINHLDEVLCGEYHSNSVPLTKGLLHDFVGFYRPEMGDIIDFVENEVADKYPFFVNSTYRPGLRGPARYLSVEVRTTRGDLVGVIPQELPLDSRLLVVIVENPAYAKLLKEYQDMVGVFANLRSMLEFIDDPSEEILIDALHLDPYNIYYVKERLSEQASLVFVESLSQHKLPMPLLHKAIAIYMDKLTMTSTVVMAIVNNNLAQGLDGAEIPSDCYEAVLAAGGHPAICHQPLRVV